MSASVLPCLHHLRALRPLVVCVRHHVTSRRQTLHPTCRNPCRPGDELGFQPSPHLAVRQGFAIASPCTCWPLAELNCPIAGDPTSNTLSPICCCFRRSQRAEPGECGATGRLSNRGSWTTTVLGTFLASEPGVLPNATMTCRGRSPTVRGHAAAIALCTMRHTYVETPATLRRWPGSIWRSAELFS